MSANGHYPATITKIQIHTRTPSSTTILLKLDVAAGELAMRGVEAFNAVRYAEQRGKPVRVGSRVVCTLCRSKGEGVEGVGGFVVVGGGDGAGLGGGDGVLGGGDGVEDRVEEGGDGDGVGADGHQSGDGGDSDGDGGWWWRRWVRRNAVVGWHLRGLV